MIKNRLRANTVNAVLLIYAILFALAGASCSRDEGQGTAGERLRFEESIMGPFDTVTTLIAYTKDEAAFEQFAALVKQDLDHYHKLFDFYNSYPGINNISTINEQAGKQPVPVDPAIIDFLEQCLWANDISDGRVNMALGAVLSIWHDLRMQGIDDPATAVLPDPDALKLANQHTDIRRVKLDKEAGTVFLTDPDMSLDVGSGAKGYACELVAQHAIEAGYDSFVISLGGNIRAVGVKADSGAKWRIGIKNPDLDAQEQIIDVLQVSDLAIVTSGVYERYYTVNGVKYHHIIDPDTLMPSQYFDSVTVVAPSSATADAITTALLNMSYPDGKEMLAQLENCEALWLKGTDRYSTEGYDELLGGQ
ncbi:MAG: FAD:protein FMN transferase [Saccharofermentanales bacterium]|jgi:thiamine biosynthesis lipoprotein|nr:FAD:protein FMN transferase [Bacillota bacterium]